MLLAFVCSDAMAEWVLIAEENNLSRDYEPSRIHEDGKIARMWSLPDWKICPA